MGQLRGIPIAPREGAEPSWRTGPDEARSRRVVVMLVVIWALNLADLAFTLFAQQLGNFRELNPLAAPLMHSPALLVVFKLALVGFGTTVLLVYRRKLITEISCLMLCGVYAGLSALWVSYYQTAL